MTHYVVGLLKEMRDAEKMAEYRKVAADALEKHGGKIVVPPTPPEKLEGEAEAPKAIVLLSFPTPNHAHAWHDDPELAPIHAMRHAGANISFFSLDTTG